MVNTIRPPRESGFESLAVQKARSRSVKLDVNSEKSNIFDSESEVFSAFDNDDESSANINISVLGSEYNGSPTKGITERDIEGIDGTNMISLTGQNRDFQKLVEEAKAEKEK